MSIPAFLTGISMAVTGFKTAVKTLDEAKIIAATQELDAKLIDAGAHILAQQQEATQAIERERTLLGRIHDLEDKVRELEETASEKNRYELVEVYPGTITYRIKEAAQNGEPMHYLCPGCLDNKSMKSILQFQTRDKVMAACHSCGKHYRFADSIYPAVPRLPRGGGPHSWMGV